MIQMRYNMRSPSDTRRSRAEQESLVAYDRPPVVDQPRAEAAVRELLLALGEDPERDGLRETPRRVARMYAELFRGRLHDPAEHLQKTFDESYDDVVISRDIRFASLCEHHLLPFVGRAHVAYIPDGKVVGLSKLARTVELFARRPQVQERLTRQIADALVENLSPRGVLVLIESEHHCMKIRGVEKCGSAMVTRAARGVLASDDVQRREVLDLIRGT